MTGEELALVQAIAAQPGDDLPRLVYADWLEEHDRGIQAEFIRLQIEIAKLQNESQSVRNSHVHLWKRQQQILEHHAHELSSPNAFLAAADRVVYERGFVAELEFTVEAFLEHAPAIQQWRPLPDVVKVSHALRRGYDLITNPGFALVTHLIGHDLGSEIQPFEPMVATYGRATDIAAAIVAPTRLRSVDLEGCGITDRFMQDLPILFPQLPALTALDLSNNLLTDWAIGPLLESSLPRTLTQLVLGANAIGNQGAIELADRWPRQSPLKYLNLRFTNITREGQAALTARFGGVVDLF